MGNIKRARRVIIYRGFEIALMGGHIYHIYFGNNFFHATYNGGITEIISEIDEIISLLKGGIK